MVFSSHDFMTSLNVVKGLYFNLPPSSSNKVFLSSEITKKKW